MVPRSLTNSKFLFAGLSTMGITRCRRLAVKTMKRTAAKRRV